MIADPKVIRAKFLETEEHYLTAWQRNPKQAKLGLLVFISFSLAMALTAPDALRNQRKGDQTWWLAHAVMGVIFVFIWYWMGPFGRRRHMKKVIRKLIKNPPTEAWLEFADEGFLVTGQGGKSSFHPWPTISSACLFQDGVFIYFDENAHAYQWIPRTAFESDADYETILKRIQQKVAKVKRHDAKA